MSGELLAVYEDGRTVRVDNTYEAIKEALHQGTIDLCAMPTPDAYLFLDDEGMIKELPMNVPASIMSGQCLFGPVVLVGPADSEGETLPPPERILTAFENLAGVWRAVAQDALAKGQAIAVRADSNSIPAPQMISMTEEEFAHFLETGEVPGAR
jgi:hypothetical protein